MLKFFKYYIYIFFFSLNVCLISSYIYFNVLVDNNSPALHWPETSMHCKGKSVYWLTALPLSQVTSRSLKFLTATSRTATESSVTRISSSCWRSWTIRTTSAVNTNLSVSQGHWTPAFMLFLTFEYSPSLLQHETHPSGYTVCWQVHGWK